MSYYLVKLKGYKLYNNSVHSVWKRMNTDPQINILNCNDSSNVIKFISANQNDTKKTLLIYHYQHTNNFIFDILKHIRTYSELLLRVYFFTFDYWHRGDQPFTKIRNLMYIAKNHHVITFSPSFENLQRFHNNNLLPYKSNIHHFNLWCCYENSFTPLNNNPINKIVVSGAISPAYPERKRMLTFNGVVRMPFMKSDVNSASNAFSSRLNKYLCCFTSSVHVMSFPSRTRANTHLILLKVFEILASGSLLLYPQTEEQQMCSIGLIPNIHYITVTLSECEKTINYILDPANRKVIDTIRKAGQDYAHENFSGKQRYDQLMNLLKV